MKEWCTTCSTTDGVRASVGAGLVCCLNQPNQLTSNACSAADSILQFAFEMACIRAEKLPEIGMSLQVNWQLYYAVNLPDFCDFAHKASPLNVCENHLRHWAESVSCFSVHFVGGCLPSSSQFHFTSFTIASLQGRCFSVDFGVSCRTSDFHFLFAGFEVWLPSPLATSFAHGLHVDLRLWWEIWGRHSKIGALQ